MIVRYELDGEIALYCANNTLENHKGSYRVIAVDEHNKESVVLNGEYDGPENCSRMLQPINETGSPTLFIIEWIENDKKYYNHFIITEGSLEYEMEIKRIFGILLCADEEKDIRDYVMKMIVSYKSEMKFLLSQELDKEKLVLYYLKKQKQFFDDGHQVPGKDVEFWLHNYLLYYNHTDNNMTNL